MAMAMATHGLLLPTPTRFNSVAGGLPPTSFSPCCASCQLQQWRSSTGMSENLCNISVGRQLRHGGVFLASYYGRQSDMQSFKGTKKQQSKIVTGALPVEFLAAATAVAVGGALFALTKLNKDAETGGPAKTTCEACGGSGVCPACNGEGFLNKNLSPDAAAKARATARDAATRYTAGLAKKWNYCTTCGGGRGCQLCEDDCFTSWLPRLKSRIG